MRIVRDPHTAEETYVKTKAALDTRPIDHLESYLYQTARNLALDHQRKRSFRSRFEQAEYFAEEVQTYPMASRLPRTLVPVHRWYRYFSRLGFFLQQVEGLIPLKSNNTKSNERSPYLRCDGSISLFVSSCQAPIQRGAILACRCSPRGWSCAIVLRPSEIICKSLPLRAYSSLATRLFLGRRET